MFALQAIIFLNSFCFCSFVTESLYFTGDDDLSSRKRKGIVRIPSNSEENTAAQHRSAENNPTRSVLIHSVTAENGGHSSKVHFHNSSAENNIVYPSPSDED